MTRSRIAPTPSGYLHIGNAVNFVLTWLWVRKQNGKLLLRIDDLDAPRAKPEYLDDIFRTLEWLGIDWDEGPQSVEEHTRQYSQQLRIERYHQLISQLIDAGIVFACECSRKTITELQYPGTCLGKNLPFNQPDTSLRMVTPETAPIIINDFRRGAVSVDLYSEMRHFVIRRRDGIPAYQIASLADDIDNNINLIIRGEDLLHSTAAQLYLAQLLHLKPFLQTIFYHHPLLKDEQGNKLSKSAGSISLKAWRDGNQSAEKFYLMLSNLLKLNDKAGSPHELLQSTAAQPII